MIRVVDVESRTGFSFPQIMPRLRLHMAQHILSWSKIRLFLQVNAAALFRMRTA